MVRQPRSVRLRISAAGHLAKRGNFEGAIQHAAAATEIEPEYAEAWINLSQLQLQAGQNREALASLRRAEQAEFLHSADRAALAIFSSRALRRNGQNDEAVTVLERAVGMTWDESLLLEVELAEALAAAGRTEEAERAMIALLQRLDLPRSIRRRVSRGREFPEVTVRVHRAARKPTASTLLPERESTPGSKNLCRSVKFVLCSQPMKGVLVAFGAVHPSMGVRRLPTRPSPIRLQARYASDLGRAAPGHSI